MPANALILILALLGSIILSACKPNDANLQQKERNLAIAERFLTANKMREGMIESPTGLQYEVLIPSLGAQPLPHDRATIHYTGYLLGNAENNYLEGETFDSSYERGGPQTFYLDQVIPGWAEGIPLMTVGSKFRFYLPPDLGYDNLGVGDTIEPFSVLIFDIELLNLERLTHAYTFERGGTIELKPDLNLRKID